MRRLLVLLAALLAACNGSSGTTGKAILLKVRAEGALLALAGLGEGVQQALPALLVPPVAAARGIVFAPDAAPNSFTFHVPVDGDGDGTNETVLDGTVALNGGLFAFGPGFGGTIDATITLAGGRTLAAALEFRVAGNGAVDLFGSGTLTDAAGLEVEFEIDAGSPLVLMVANGTTTVANLCDYSAAGPVRIEARGLGETYAALWTFAFDRKPVAITGASHTDALGSTTPQPDASFVIGPCAGGTIQDWAGTYDFNWFCNPQEEGDSVFVVTVTGPNTIHVNDDGLEYDATAVPGNPHTVTGFFFDQDYREDFLWTLSPDGATFTQQSVYVFEPPIVGGGVCGGVGTKRP